MYNRKATYPNPYYVNTPKMYQVYGTYPCPFWVNTQMYNPNNSYSPNQYYPYITPTNNSLGYAYSQQVNNDSEIELRDFGPDPYVVNIEQATMQNDTFRTALWTGEHLQLTLMSIEVGDDIGLEVHPNDDQFIRIEEGTGLVQMGDSEDALDFQEIVTNDFVFFIPAGKWHNLTNTGDTPLKLYSIYAPPAHPRGTVHETKAEAEAAEENNGQ